MTRCCTALLAGVLLGVLIVAATGAALIEFTGALENRFHQ